MINGKTVFAVITARAGSKRLPGKNLKPFRGKPLFVWSVLQAKESTVVDRIVMSTDSSEIADVARAAGAEVPFIRPADLSTDLAITVDVVRHAMQYVEKHDYVVLLQPTSPLRLAADILAAVSICDSKGAASCVSICSFSKSLRWMYSLDEGGRIMPSLDEQCLARITQPIYLLNGAIYVARWEHIATGGEFVDKTTIGYEMPAERSVDIDTALDFEFAGNLASEGRQRR